jgi:hypothetical protein
LRATLGEREEPRDQIDRSFVGRRNAPIDELEDRVTHLAHATRPVTNVRRAGLRELCRPLDRVPCFDRYRRLLDERDSAVEAADTSAVGT